MPQPQQAVKHDYSTRIHTTDEVVVSLLTFRIETLYCVCGTNNVWCLFLSMQTLRYCLEAANRRIIPSPVVITAALEANYDREKLLRCKVFNRPIGLASSKDPESNAGGSVATGRASHAGQVEGDDPDEKE